MANRREVHDFEFAPLGDDEKFVSLVIRDTDVKAVAFVLPTSALPAMVTKLLRIAGHPKIRDILPACNPRIRALPISTSCLIRQSVRASSKPPKTSAWL